VRRRGKLTPYEFVVLMTVGQASLKHPSLSAMVQAIEAKLSREGLHQRFTPQAAQFLQECLHETLRQKFTFPKTLDSKLLRPFQKVLIFDSTSWDVDPQLQAMFPGSGGGASVANCKLQAGYEFKRGELGLFELSAGTRPDQAYSAKLPDLVAKGDLVLTDQGYFKVKTFRQFQDKEAFFLSRLLFRTTLRNTETLQAINVSAILRGFKGNTLELKVIMGNTKDEHTNCRLICLRVSEQVANARRRKLIKEATKKGRTPSQEYLELCDWTLLVTNVPANWLPTEMVYPLYRLRWQIELLFKQLKSVLQIHQSNTGRESRLRCELYGKLLVAVLVHRIHAFLQGDLWNSQRREVSFDKLHKRFQERAFLLLRQFLLSLATAIHFLDTEVPSLLKSCIKAHQPSRPTTLQRLDQGDRQTLPLP